MDLIKNIKIDELDLFNDFNKFISTRLIIVTFFNK